MDAIVTTICGHDICTAGEPCHVWEAGGRRERGERRVVALDADGIKGRLQFVTDPNVVSGNTYATVISVDYTAPYDPANPHDEHRRRKVAWAMERDHGTYDFMVCDRFTRQLGFDAGIVPVRMRWMSDAVLWLTFLGRAYARIVEAPKAV